VQDTRSTAHGTAQHSAAPSRLLTSERDASYRELLSYIVSNAVAGEIMAVENYSQMVHLMPDTATKIETVDQCREECKHIQMLSKLGVALDFKVQQRIVEPQWNRIREHFADAVAKRDLTACLIVQDLMTESMAIVLYRTLAGEADTDPATAKVAHNILGDELAHLQIGTTRLRAALVEDPVAAHDALVWAHHRVMPELFGLVSTSCHFLCDELGVDCGSLKLSAIATDIATLRAKALDRYVETLDTVGFDPRVVNRLVASMAAYGGVGESRVGVAAPPCCPSPSRAG
jgi:fatty aldehyde decarbonylase